MFVCAVTPYSRHKMTVRVHRRSVLLCSTYNKGTGRGIYEERQAVLPGPQRIVGDYREEVRPVSHVGGPQLDCSQSGLLKGQTEQQLVGQVPFGCGLSRGRSAESAQSLGVGLVPVSGPVVSDVPSRHHPDHSQSPGDLIGTLGCGQDPRG